MLLLAISPWHIYISRLGHEVNAGSTCIVLAALFFLIAMHHTKKNWFLYLSAALFGISFYTYQSEKIFTPLIILVLVLFFWKNLFAIKIQTLVAFCVFIFITIPVFTVSVSPVGLTRLKGTSAFNHLDTMYAESAKQVLLAKKQGNFFEEIIHNRRIIPIKIFLENYFSHMNPFWLYGNNGADAFKAPQFGLFFWWELFFLLSGIFFIVKNSVDKKVQWFMYSWIAISFVAPGITTQAPHAMRAFTVLPMPFVIESYGILGIWLLAKTYIQRIFFISICLFTLIVGLYGFSYQYFFVFPKKESKPFSYALSQAMQFLINTKAENNKIIISNTDNLYQSYMFYLFATRYNPRTYLQQGGSVSGGFAQTHKIKNIEFRPIVWEKEKKKQGMLYLGNPSDFPANVFIIQKFFYLDGTEGVWLVKP